MKLKEKWDAFINGPHDKREKEFLPAILEVTETPPSPVGRLVMWSILGLVVVGIIWACVGKINEVAVASGQIIPVGQVKTIQVKNKGIVKHINVKDGDEVKAGDVLMTLDPTSTDADYKSLQQQAAYYHMDIARLTAELQGTPFVPPTSDYLDAKDIVAERALFESRRSQYTSQQAAAANTVAQKRAALSAEQTNLDKYASMLEIARDKEQRLESLVRDNAIAEFQLLGQRSERINYEKSTEAQKDKVNETASQLAEAEQKSNEVDATYKKDVMSNLVDARKHAYEVEEAIRKADENNRMTEVKAPVSGRVYNLAIHTEGAIVTDAQALMMIVPDDVELEIEAWAENKDIGFIKEGQEAEVKIDSFNFQKFGVVKAAVTEISPNADSSLQDKEKDKKYRIVLKITDDSINIFGTKAALLPGMHVSAEIKIKEKRIIDFFLDPFRKYTSEALRER